MKRFLKQLVSQKVINNYYHLPRAVLANTIYRNPTQKLRVIGVTGTDGKTTTTNMIYEILRIVGKKVSMVSTVKAVIGGRTYDTGFHVTSPDPFLIQKFAHSAGQNQDEYLVLEVTSHALDQYRFWGIKFDIAVITNITHEHLDYHKSFENYKNTKLQILKGVKAAVVNENLRQTLKRGLVAQVLTFGINSGDLTQKELKLKLQVPGEYNIENALASLGVAFVLGIDRTKAQAALEAFVGVEGRMQKIPNQRGIEIVVDFAHTPNGLENALQTLKATRKNKLIAIIWCEGYRDEGKRSLMGEVASKLADYVIVTAVDPRGLIDQINEQITTGAKKGGAVLDKNYFIINDRQAAIDFAINKLAKKGDTVGIFGKGHEKSMNIDNRGEQPWSDLLAVETSLSNGR